MRAWLEEAGEQQQGNLVGELRYSFRPAEVLEEAVG